jgi:integrase
MQAAMPTLPHNARLVETLKALDGKRTQYRSQSVIGLELECLASGKRTWRVRYRVGRGKARRFRAYKIGDADVVSLGEAVDEARRLLAKVQVEGRDPHAERASPGRGDFDAVVAGWTAWQKNNGRRTWQRNQRQYELHVKRVLGSKPASEITRHEITALLDRVAERAGGTAANRTQALISAAFSWAVDEGIVDDHPAYRIRRRAAETPRDRKVTENELRAIWQATFRLRQQVGRVIRLLIITGQRRSEVCQMARAELNGKLWTIPKERTKNKLGHVVPLPPLARRELDEALKDAEWSPYVFQARLRTPKPMNATTPSAAFAEMMRDLSIENVKLHDMRHVAATEMAGLKVPLDIRQRVQNQITGRRQTIGSVYDQHEYFEEKQRALRVWSIRLRDILQSRKRRTPWRY